MQINNCYYDKTINTFYTITGFNTDGLILLYWANMTTEKNGFTTILKEYFQGMINHKKLELLP